MPRGTASSQVVWRGAPARSTWLSYRHGTAFGCVGTENQHNAVECAQVCIRCTRLRALMYMGKALPYQDVLLPKPLCRSSCTWVHECLRTQHRSRACPQAPVDCDSMVQQLHYLAVQSASCTSSVARTNTSTYLHARTPGTPTWCLMSSTLKGREGQPDSPRCSEQGGFQWCLVRDPPSHPENNSVITVAHAIGNSSKKRINVPSEGHAKVTKKSTSRNLSWLLGLGVGEAPKRCDRLLLRAPSPATAPHPHSRPAAPPRPTHPRPGPRPRRSTLQQARALEGPA